MEETLLQRPELDESFKTFYKQAVMPELKQIKVRYQKYFYNYQKYKAKAFRTVIPLLIVIFLLGFISAYFYFFSIPVLFVAMSFLSKIRGKMTKKIRIADALVINGMVCPSLLEYFYSDVRYSALENLPRHVELQFNFRPVSTPRRGNFISLTIGDITVKLYDINEILSDNDDESFEEFRGVMCEADFNKEITGNTIVMDRSPFWKPPKKHPNIPNAHLVILESDAFAKQFAVYSTSQTEARYILSPSLMQRILDFQVSIGEKIEMSFSKDKVYAKIHGVSIFNDEMFRNYTRYGLIAAGMDAILKAADIVYHLNLNNQIWKKA